MNLDGYALPIKKLKGTEPVESLDLSGKKLGVASAIVIASLISVNGSLTSLNLGHNQLCGLDEYGRGTYTADGITAIADALRVNGSLTKMRYVTPQTNLSEFGSARTPTLHILVYASDARWLVHDARVHVRVRILRTCVMQPSVRTRSVFPHPACAAKRSAPSSHILPLTLPTVLFAT